MLRQMLSLPVLLAQLLTSLSVRALSLRSERMTPRPDTTGTRGCNNPWALFLPWNTSMPMMALQ